MPTSRAARAVGDLARRELGFPSLRPGQEEAVAAVIGGRDVLAVLPTGSGKSAIYQLAGAALGGVTVVVSPLIALQRDQVIGIGDRLGGAVEINSSLTEHQRAETFARIDRGEVRFVFVAPEQLANEETRDALAAGEPHLIAVDEAHCISSWGHDFRPEYLRLGEFIDALGRPSVLALTATAAPPVRAEIIEQLHLRDPLEVVRGFFRENIHLAVVESPDDDAARTLLREHAARLTGTGLVYVATQREAEALAHELTAAGRAAEPYHAGLSTTRRNAVHERFLEDEPIIVVATTAFGMGIDAPHVRFVLHAEPPESLDAYYQEFGRSGRDGRPATAVVFHRTADAGGRRFRTGTTEMTLAELERVAEEIESSGVLAPDELRERVKLSRARLTVALDLLERGGALAADPEREVAWRSGAPAPEEAAAIAAHAHEGRRAVERTRADMMRHYLESASCRWRTLLGYFGQPVEMDCGRCDNCDAARSRAASNVTDAPYRLGARVRHPKWGDGQVIGYENDTMTVLFDEGGYRRLCLPLVRENGLLDTV